MKNKTLNLKIMTEPYKGERKIESSVKSGFASVKQKSTIIALKVLSDAYIDEGRTIKAGSKVHINEEVLYAKFTTQRPYESAAVEGPFVFVDFNDVMFVTEE
jgi:hypothetical protein